MRRGLSVIAGRSEALSDSWKPTAGWLACRNPVPAGRRGKLDSQKCGMETRLSVALAPGPPLKSPVIRIN